MKKKNNPREGQLFVTRENRRLYISGDGLKDDIFIDSGSVVMYLGETTFAELLEERGFDFDKLLKAEKHWPADEKFWSFLYKEHLFKMPCSEVDNCIKAVKKKVLPPEGKE